MRARGNKLVMTDAIATSVQKRWHSGRRLAVLCGALKSPFRGECVYEDAIKGRVVVPWADVDDQVLMKSDGYPTYHLANVVDDH